MTDAPSTRRLAAARKLRLKERKRYLAANPGLPDAEARWSRYEQLIEAKYAPDQSIDVAWIVRDWSHMKLSGR